MELVIKIPDKQYKNIMEYEGNANMISDMTLSEINDYLYQYIKGVYNGIPLPKGYGRIVDISPYEKKEKDKEPWVLKRLVGQVIQTVEVVELKDIPTIIEKDKENEDGDSN